MVYHLILFFLNNFFAITMNIRKTPHTIIHQTKNQYPPIIAIENHRNPNHPPPNHPPFFPPHTKTSFLVGLSVFNSVILFTDFCFVFFFVFLFILFRGVRLLRFSICALIPWSAPHECSHRRRLWHHTDQRPNLGTVECAPRGPTLDARRQQTGAHVGRIHDHANTVDRQQLQSAPSVTASTASPPSTSPTSATPATAQHPTQPSQPLAALLIGRVVAQSSRRQHLVRTLHERVGRIFDGTRRLTARGHRGCGHR